MDDVVNMVPGDEGRGWRSTRDGECLWERDIEGLSVWTEGDGGLEGSDEGDEDGEGECASKDASIMRPSLDSGAPLFGP